MARLRHTALVDPGSAIGELPHTPFYARLPRWLLRNLTIAPVEIVDESGKKASINETTPLGLLICWLRGKI
jgi:hypothetical protein